MKIRIELRNDLEEDEVLIRCGRVDDTIGKIQQFILEQSSQVGKITLYKQNQEFYVPLGDILFFETEGEHVYAHTADDTYRVKERLYELEEKLPKSFIRAAKGAVLNTKQVYSVARNLTASSLVKFSNSHKQVYVSRYYYKELRQRLNERSRFE